MQGTIEFFLNGQKKTVAAADAFVSLSDYLRKRNQMTGTKIVCEEGDCGACTVIVGFLQYNHENPAKSSLKYQIINSCIHFLFQLDATHIISIEGLTPSQTSLIQEDSELNEIQTQMTKCHGAQCGFCTPGFVTAMTDLAVKNNGKPLTRDQLQTGLTGNLCRCTGYEPILQVGLAADITKIKAYADLYKEKEIVAALNLIYTESKLIEEDPEDLIAENPARKIYLPTSLEELARLKKENPAAKIIAGATDLGVLYNKGKIYPEIFITLAKLDFLRQVTETDSDVTFGALNNWSMVEKYCLNLYPEFSAILNIFASPQIKNVATIGGNLVNASPIADSIPFFKAVNAELELISANGKRRLNINDFYKGYKQLDLRTDEILASITLPKLGPNEKLFLYKVSRRRDLDISAFTAAFYLKLSDEKIERSRLVYGGVGPIVLRLFKTEELLNGKSITDLQEKNLLEKLITSATGEITPISDVRASKEYRFLLGGNIIRKFIFELESELQKNK